MTWAKFDDKFYDDPDIDTLCHAAIALHLCGTTYCCRNLTDGRLPRGRVPKLTGGEVPQAIEDLLRVGWWVEEGDEYVIRSFLKYNKSREQVAKERQDTLSRVNRYRGSRNGEYHPDEHPSRDEASPPNDPRLSGDDTAVIEEECTSVVSGVSNAPGNDSCNAVTNGRSHDSVTPAPDSRFPIPGIPIPGIPIPDSGPKQRQQHAHAPERPPAREPPPKSAAAAEKKNKEATAQEFVERTLHEHPEWREPYAERLARGSPTWPWTYGFAILQDWLAGNGLPEPPRAPPKAAAKAAAKAPLRPGESGDTSHDNDPRWTRM